MSQDSCEGSPIHWEVAAPCHNVKRLDTPALLGIRIYGLEPTGYLLETIDN